MTSKDTGHRTGGDAMRTMVTIGVYGFDGESFLRRLREADVRLLLDVRQRRFEPGGAPRGHQGP
ncbi:hypothetical protein [Actinomadura litoris]|uniref:hypothetical protein n=1 Tax=Actinomadura litoris TaxID=2678616 RepID=UPI001FA758F2|nr:hypothetical protein [Actinomadura litoris]